MDVDSNKKYVFDIKSIDPITVEEFRKALEKLACITNPMLLKMENSLVYPETDIHLVVPNMPGLSVTIIPKA